MKKKILFALTFVVSSFTYSQHASFGLKGGANFSNIWVPDNKSSNYKAGLHAGGFAHIHLSRKWALQPELLYSTQGGKQTISNIESKTNLNYINIPVLVQIMFNNGFRLQAGPQLGFLVNAKSKYGNTKSDIKNTYKSTDISFPLGLSYLTKSGLGFDGRWVPGFSDIQKTGASAANNVIQLGLFYMFPYKGHTHKSKK
jgi:hypothetical protein